MNILYFDVCAVVLLCIVLASNISRRLTNGRTNKTFLLIIVLSLLATLGDLGSGFGSNYFEPSPLNSFLMYLFNYVYFLTHNNIPLLYVFYCISTMGIWHICMKDRLIIYALMIPTAIQNAFIICNILTHNIFYIDANMDYHRGSLLPVCYVCTFAIFIIGIAVMIANKKLVSKDKLYTLLSMIPINGIAIMIQFYMPNILVEMFMLSVEIHIFVIVLLRHEESLDPISGARKYPSGIPYIKGLLDTKAPMNIIFIKIINYNNINMYMGQLDYNSFLKYLSNTFKKYCSEKKAEAQIHYLENGLYGIMIEEPVPLITEQIAEKIKNLFGEKIVFGAFDILADTRICILGCPDDLSEYNTLFTFAQTFHRALPDTKDVLYYRNFSSDREFMLRNELDSIIKRGLKNNSYEMYYQPIFSTAEQRFVAAEALLRLYDDNYGNISPGLFIPAAEISGDMHAIGDFVFDQVCSFMSKQNLSEYGIDYIQVNLSPSQCIEVDLVSKIRKYIEKYNLTPDQITLELTESAADINPKIVDANVEALSEYGIKFALDDYGTGYSNIKRVTDLPIYMVKLDRGFIKNIEDTSTKIIIEDTVKMLKAMGKKVLVSGIENSSLAQHFTELGCDYFQGCEYLQGYYYCQPVPEEEFVKFIKENRFESKNKI